MTSVAAKPSRRSLLVGVALLVGAALFAGGATGAPGAARADATLTVGVLPIANTLPLDLGIKKGFFSQQWDQMPAAGFMAVFGPYVTAVVAVLDRFDTAVLAAAHQALADAGERAHDAGLPLRPEETTT